MAQYQGSIPAATAVLGYDLFVNEVWKRRGMWRFLKAFALKGSTAAGDTEVELYIGEARIANLFNTNAGFPNRDDAMPVNRYIPPNEELRCVVVDAPVTNPVNFLIDMTP